ncbi:MAG: DUF4249 family protein [Saprospiraceae bacterium]|nr:DUF4249 family protein [Saprospiraceae bacterium]
MRSLVLLLLVAVVLSNCSNDFDVAAPWKEVPIVYAILSPKDTAHYVRIEKAFLDPEASALEIAQIADSLYYPDNSITVWLERPATNSRVQLHRVDGNLEGYVRDQGIFADQPNWLYKLKPPVGQNLTPGETYKLVIVRNDGREDITAQTTLPKDFVITRPNPTDIVRKISFAYSTTSTVDWRTDENGYFFNITYILPYREEAPDGTTLLRDTLVWQAARNVEREETTVSQGTYKGTKDIAGSQFFKFLAEQLQPTSNFRYFEKGFIYLEGGGREIKEFNVTAAANSGLTGAEVYPVYTNVSEGFGLVTGKNLFKMGNIQISEATIDSMFYHPLTQGLKFRL